MNCISTDTHSETTNSSTVTLVTLQVITAVLPRVRLLYYETFNSGTTVSGVTILKKDKMSALKGTNIGCTITLNNTIGQVITVH